MSEKKEKWKIFKLGELVKILNGYAFKKSDFSLSGIPVLKIKNIKSPIVNTSDVQFINENIYKKQSKFKVNYNDILISMTGSHIDQPNSVVGRVGRFREKKGIFLINQRVGKISTKNEKILDSDFLYYFLSQKKVTYNLASCAGGSANQANIGNKDIQNIDIKLPDIQVQRKIAKILIFLDEKIELNNEINNNLLFYIIIVILQVLCWIYLFPLIKALEVLFF